MKERQLIEHWARLRNQLIFAQLAPTFLLITTVSLVPEIKAAGSYTVWATLGILLASGILGALVEYSAAHEAQAVARDLAKLEKQTRVTKNIVKNAMWLYVAKYVTPAIFVVIFVLLALALL
ncbi:MAG: hypothetical protein EBR26_05195 [Microbacteriaceae bacterium]|nr:hypothetical protein [Microbacteriaceae bacterium]